MQTTQLVETAQEYLDDAERALRIDATLPTNWARVGVKVGIAIGAALLSIRDEIADARHDANRRAD